MKKNLLILISIIIFLFSGCDSKESVKEKQVNIGVLLPLTGNGALYAKSVKEGALLAIEELNTSKYQFIIEDTKTTVKDGLFAMNKLISKNNVSIMIGPMSSSVAKAVGEKCQAKRVTMITTASAPNISTLGNYVYRIYPSDSYDGSFLAQEIINKKLFNSVIIYLNNDFGIGLSSVFQEVYEKQGGKVINKFPFDANQQDFSILVNKLKREKFDNLFIVATQKEYINIINKMYNLNITNIPIFAPVNIEDKIVVEGISSNMLEFIQYSKPKFNLEGNLTNIQNNFKKLWFKTHKEKPDIFNAYGYDLIKLTDMIIIKTENDDYHHTLENFRELNGVTGTYKFDKNGDVIRKFMLLKLKDL